MRQALRWLNEALASKDIVQEMTHYRFGDREIRATDGRLTAGRPWDRDEAFVAPGHELEKVLARMPGEIELVRGEQDITLKSGRFRGTIQTLPLDTWRYPGVEGVSWRPIPDGLLEILRELRPFISDNATQPWATCYDLNEDWVYATNNVALAGASCPGVGSGSHLLPTYAADFVLARTEGLVQWAWTDNFVAFRWEGGAWLRSQLVIGHFPEQAMGLVRSAAAEEGLVEITEPFRAAYERIAGLAEEGVTITGDGLKSSYKRAVIEEDVAAPVPEAGSSCWTAKFLDPVIKTATHWAPDRYPKPAPFRGKRLVGYIVGRR